MRMGLNGADEFRWYLRACHALSTQQDKESLELCQQGQRRLLFAKSTLAKLWHYVIFYDLLTGNL